MAHLYRSTRRDILKNRVGLFLLFYNGFGQTLAGETARPTKSASDVVEPGLGRGGLAILAPWALGKCSHGVGVEGWKDGSECGRRDRSRRLCRRRF